MTSPSSIEPLFEAVQEAALPAVWSRGVTMSREEPIQIDRATADEIVVRITLKNRPVHPKVTLWPNDEDWHCDCGDRNDPCLHIAAAVIAIKAGRVQATSTSPDTAPTGARIAYRLTRQDGALAFSRAIQRPGKPEAPLRESLVSYVGGIQSGRIAEAPLPTTQDDFGVDRALGSFTHGTPDRDLLARLLPALSACSGVTLDGSPITVVAKPLPVRARLSDSSNQGFRLERIVDDRVSETFREGAVLLGASELALVASASLGAEEREWLAQGHTFAAHDGPRLAADIVPRLERAISLEVATRRLPRLVDSAPRVVLKMERPGAGTLVVVARLVYGNPPIAEVEPRGLRQLDTSLVPTRDFAAEKALVRKVQSELHLQIGQLSRFEGDAAVRFAQQAKGWDLEGSARQAFRQAERPLQARIEAGLEGFNAWFETGSGSGERVSFEQIVEAWRENRSFFTLADGTAAPLPQGWLAKHAEVLLGLLHARDARGKLPVPKLAQAAAIAEEQGQPASEGLRRLLTQLEKREGLPSAKLPSDLRAELRPYQRAGVDWLSFLREQGLGALLADDMGLGKTLQAMCAFQGRTLVVAPTSVVQAWSEQIRKFRPSLKVSRYLGAGRTLDDKADLTLTTYGILRLDRETLGAVEWDTLLLDEAQVIRNPDSQVARAAHSLKGKFRIALSGTPIENRLEDLWSQFRFVSPGLLEDREAMAEQWQSGWLKAAVRPFILRRLKREVAPELPPRTETVLQCELSEDERAGYDAILAATKSEIVAKLREGESPFSALELLLRLRQACCALALLPGSKPGDRERSAKLDLLMDTLESAQIVSPEGQPTGQHRGLIFSQWTSYLDLIEERLRARGIPFSRLDGSTRDRDAVVTEFQSPNGPPLMLISLKAGGTGLTLTAADHVFIVDPWWNPAAENQAADRAHRIGQTQPVQIHRLVARDTVEERILELQRRKLELASSVLEAQGDRALSLTREDLLEILG